MDQGDGLSENLAGYAGGNALVRGLPERERAGLGACCRRVRLRRGEALGAGPDAPICFPEGAVLSLVDPDGIEMGIVGGEGMSGWSIVLGEGDGQMHASVQCGGAALLVPARAFTQLCRTSPAFRGAVLQFIETLTKQMVGTIRSATRHGVSARLARRLLMLHDRSDGDCFEATHAQLASALGVRRASVTDWLHVMEGDHLVRSTRNSLRIVDRAALERLAGAAYGPAEAGLVRPKLAVVA